MVNPEKMLAFDPCIEKYRVLMACRPQGLLKIRVFSKISSCVSSKPFLFANNFYIKRKAYKYFLCIILDSNFVRIIFVRYREYMHFFKNFLLMCLVWATYESPVCVHSAPECFCTLQLITFG